MIERDPHREMRCYGKTSKARVLEGHQKCGVRARGMDKSKNHKKTIKKNEQARTRESKEEAKDPKPKPEKSNLSQIPV
ncbi:hypothetical protein Tco_0751728, partial [Tanacetum coccineum]